MAQFPLVKFIYNYWSWTEISQFVVTNWRAEQPRDLGSISNRNEEIFLFPKKPRPALGSTQSPCSMGTNITDQYLSQNKFCVALLDNLLGQGNFKPMQLAQTGRQKDQASMRHNRQRQLNRSARRGGELGSRIIIFIIVIITSIIGRSGLKDAN